jgi:hypothetical protein
MGPGLQIVLCAILAGDQWAGIKPLPAFGGTQAVAAMTEPVPQ